MVSRLVALVVLVTGCTPEQIEAWRAWHTTDPNAAVQFLDGTREPEPEPRGVWDRLAECESGGDWSLSTGNGYYGGLQFSLRSWRAVGGSGYPHHASRAEQIARAERLLDLQGWGAWPTCSRRLGLR